MVFDSSHFPEVESSLEVEENVVKNGIRGTMHQSIATHAIICGHSCGLEGSRILILFSVDRKPPVSPGIPHLQLRLPDLMAVLIYCSLEFQP